MLSELSSKSIDFFSGHFKIVWLAQSGNQSYRSKLLSSNRWLIKQLILSVVFVVTDAQLLEWSPFEKPTLLAGLNCLLDCIEFKGCSLEKIESSERNKLMLLWYNSTNRLSTWPFRLCTKTATGLA